MGREFVNDTFGTAAGCADEVVSGANPDITASEEGLQSTWDRHAFTRGAIDPVLGREHHSVSKSGVTTPAGDNKTIVSENEIEVTVRGDSVSTDVIVSTSAQGDPTNTRSERHQVGSDYISNQKLGDRAPLSRTDEPVFEDEAISPQPPAWTETTANNIKAEIDECIQDKLSTPAAQPPPPKP
ncbi:MAG: hypothetical protein GW778_01080 [Alphaproteobacteria bacterium]|nr:hypothetical protein [Alphaproteobacteria bacterium]